MPSSSGAGPAAVRFSKLLETADQAAQARLATPVVVPEEQRQAGVGPCLEIGPDRGQRLLGEEDDALLVPFAGDQALAGAAVLAMRHNHHFGDRTLTADALWERLGVPATAAAGIAFLERWQSAWRDAIAAQPEDLIDRPSDGPPGSIDGRFPFADVILHVTAEVIHHGAEIALLRDLDQARREIE